MSTPTFEIVDVFARRRYAGNQLAVVYPQRSLESREMQSIAAEFGFSETTFVDLEDSASEAVPVRIFTPETELPFAGHPTIGTAAVIRHQLEDPGDEIVLKEGVGPITVRVEHDGSGREVYFMDAPEPSFGPSLDHDRVAAAISLSREDLLAEFAPQVVECGIGCLVVPVRSREAIKAAATDGTYSSRIFAEYDLETILLFTPETYRDRSDLNVRVFADAVGVPEDPATGSANASLAAYLLKHRYLETDDIDIRVEQGYELDRPAELHLRASIEGDKPVVCVGGSVVFVARGQLL